MAVAGAASTQYRGNQDGGRWTLNGHDVVPWCGFINLTSDHARHYQGHDASVRHTVCISGIGARYVPKSGHRSGPNSPAVKSCSHLGRMVTIRITRIMSRVGPMRQHAHDATGLSLR